MADVSVATPAHCMPVFARQPKRRRYQGSVGVLKRDICILFAYRNADGHKQGIIVHWTPLCSYVHATAILLLSHAFNVLMASSLELCIEHGHAACKHVKKGKLGLPCFAGSVINAHTQSEKLKTVSKKKLSKLSTRPTT